MHDYEDMSGVRTLGEVSQKPRKVKTQPSLAMRHLSRSELKPHIGRVTDGKGKKYLGPRRESLFPKYDDVNASTELGFYRLRAWLAALEFQRIVTALRHLYSVRDWEKRNPRGTELRDAIATDIKKAERDVDIAHVYFKRTQSLYYQYVE